MAVRIPKWMRVTGLVLGGVGASYGTAMFAAGASRSDATAHESKQDERLAGHDADVKRIDERLDGTAGEGGIRGRLDKIDRSVGELRVILDERLPKKSGMGD